MASILNSIITCALKYIGEYLNTGTSKNKNIIFLLVNKMTTKIQVSFKELYL